MAEAQESLPPQPHRAQTHETNTITTEAGKHFISIAQFISETLDAHNRIDSRNGMNRATTFPTCRILSIFGVRP
jgi:hypothetical protein